MFRSLIVLLVCLIPTVVWSAPQSSYPTKATPVAGDKVLIVDSQDSWRTKNVLFSSFVGLTSLPTVDNQIMQATGMGTYGWTSSIQGLIDDTAGAGDTDKLLSASSITTKIQTSRTPVTAPTTSSSTCTVGQWSSNSTYFYICTATNTWIKIAITAW